MFKKIGSLFVAALLSIPAVASQVTEIDDSIPWEVVSVTDKVGEVSTWRRSIPGADVKQFRGEMIMEESLLDILLTIDTPEDLHEWVYFCVDSQVVEPHYSYMQYRGIWPVKGRYVTVESKSWEEDGVIYIRSRNNDDIDPQKKNLVKIKELNNLFEITPIHEGLTKVRFTAFVDLAGSLPKWFTNATSSRAPSVTLKGLRDKLAKGERDFSQATVYDLSHIAEDKEGLKDLIAKIPAAPTVAMED